MFWAQLLIKMQPIMNKNNQLLSLVVAILRIQPIKAKAKMRTPNTSIFNERFLEYCAIDMNYTMKSAKVHMVGSTTPPIWLPSIKWPLK